MTGYIVLAFAFASVVLATVLIVRRYNVYARAARALAKGVTVLKDSRVADAVAQLRLADGTTVTRHHHSHGHFELVVQNDKGDVTGEVRVYEYGAKPYGAQSNLAWSYGPTLALAFRDALANAA